MVRNVTRGPWISRPATSGVCCRVVNPAGGCRKAARHACEPEPRPCRVGALLAERLRLGDRVSHLGDRVSHRVGDALELPFPAGAFVGSRSPGPPGAESASEVAFIVPIRLAWELVIRSAAISSN
jgi:hypothetical protein